MQDERSRTTDQPEPGYFLKRLCRGGWPVPCRIIHWDDGTWQAEIDGELWGIPNADPVLAEGVLDIWHYGRATDEATYRQRSAWREWARTNRPDDPSLHPRRPVNLADAPPIF